MTIPNLIGVMRPIQGRKSKPKPHGSKTLCAFRWGGEYWPRTAESLLQPELLDLVVIVLAIEDVPLLRPLYDDIPLRSDLLPRCRIDFRLLGQQFFQRLPLLLP